MEKNDVNSASYIIAWKFLLIIHVVMLFAQPPSYNTQETR